MLPAPDRHASTALPGGFNPGNPITIELPLARRLLAEIECIDKGDLRRLDTTPVFRTHFPGLQRLEEQLPRPTVYLLENSLYFTIYLTGRGIRGRYLLASGCRCGSERAIGSPRSRS